MSTTLVLIALTSPGQVSAQSNCSLTCEVASAGAPAQDASPVTLIDNLTPGSQSCAPAGGPIAKSSTWSCSSPNGAWALYDDGGSACSNQAEPPYGTGSYYSGTVDFSSPVHVTSSFLFCQPPPGYINPQYEIVSLLYAPPGNTSSNGFTNTTTSGHVTTIGSSFTDAITFSYTQTFGPSNGDWGISAGATFGFSTTSFNTTATQNTYSSATGSQVKSAENQVDHTQDVFFLWLNPQVTITQTTPTAATYTVAPPIQSSSQPDPGVFEPMDIVNVSVQAMQSNPTTIPLGALEPQTIDDKNGISVSGLPGLASICKNQAYYPNNCASSPNKQCGCVTSDFTTIVNQDVLLTIPNSEAPSTLNPNRFVSIESQVLEGPQCPTGQTCDYTANSFTATDSNQTVVTNGNTQSYSVGYTVSGGIPPWSLKLTQTWTWSNTESKGTINGTSHQAAVTLGTTEHECYEEVPIYEDTLYNTFVFQQPTSAGGC